MIMLGCSGQITSTLSPVDPYSPITGADAGIRFLDGTSWATYEQDGTASIYLSVGEVDGGVVEADSAIATADGAISQSASDIVPLGPPLDRSKRFCSAYRVFPDQFGDINGHLSAVQMDPSSIAALAGKATKLIVELGHTNLTFGGAPGGGMQINPAVDANLDQLKKTLALYENSILAIHLFDEPYIHGLSNNELEQVVAKVKARFPKIPVYINFSTICFETPLTDLRCESQQTTLPSNVDWVGFDSYSGGGGPFNPRRTNFVNKLKTMTSKPIILVPEAFDLFIKHPTVMVDEINKYYDLFKADPKIRALEFFAWTSYQGSTESWKGVDDLHPTVKQRIFEICDEINGKTAPPPKPKPGKPLYRYHCSILQDHWITTSDKTSACYAYETTLGYLGSAGPDGAGSALYDCLVGSRDHMVSTDPSCEGAQKVGLLGYMVNKAYTKGAKAIYRCLTGGNDHFVSIDPGCEGQQKEALLGYVASTSSL